ncbi:MAG: FAD-dependent oxidoreductase [Sphingomonas sp.]|jgi:monoamine oxidase|uniref:flavin monoamine oxidase family protein n=1 Tax=Sphingomonas sp. TaxID=28214 RepID=UPI00356422CE
MSTKMGRAEYLKSHPRASAWAELADATNEQLRITPGPVKLEEGSFAGKRALILGAGVGGLTTAYELLFHRTGMHVTILEAQNRTGGRCLSLRTGDTLTEDVDDALFGSKPAETQVVRFEWPVGDAEPYLNAGPGRIPSAHKRLLSYLRDFGVDIEVYVMNSMSNLVHMGAGPLKGKPQVYRQIDHNLRGWLAQLVHEHAAELLGAPSLGIPEGERRALVAKFKSLMVSFGELDEKGRYAPTAGTAGFENAISRAGFDILPGVAAGEIAKAIKLEDLLASEYWKQTRFYQPVDFLWQQTIFQPVGGMDQVQRAFARKVAELGGTIHLNSPVTSIGWDAKRKEFVVQVAKIGSDETIEYRADYCFSNLAMPFLEKLLSDDLRGGKGKSGFAEPFKQGLDAVFAAQARPRVDPEGKYQDKFLAATTKVGWQGDRTLWQGRLITHEHEDDLKLTTLVVPDSEEGVVPIFGGISWTSHDIVQIWYPSTAYHDRKGILTGAYNFGQIAADWGRKTVDERLKLAREGARQFGKKFGNGLQEGLAIAWQNMPYIKGGWAYWQSVGTEEEAARHFNNLSQGTGVHDAKGKLSDPVFFVVGDQLSSLPGWQEGAIAAALNALTRMARPDLEIPHLEKLPDTRLLVEGI